MGETCYFRLLVAVDTILLGFSASTLQGRSAAAIRSMPTTAQLAERPNSSARSPEKYAGCFPRSQSLRLEGNDVPWPG
jgi:hypothetical protein